jgi:DNA-directed RNA polymerase specialized sigma subunit
VKRTRGATWHEVVRLFKEGKLSRRQIGETCKVTRQRVSQILRDARCLGVL